MKAPLAALLVAATLIAPVATIAPTAALARTCGVDAPEGWERPGGYCGLRTSTTSLSTPVESIAPPKEEEATPPCGGHGWLLKLKLNQRILVAC